MALSPRFLESLKGIEDNLRAEEARIRAEEAREAQAAKKRQQQQGQLLREAMKEMAQQDNVRQAQIKKEAAELHLREVYAEKAKALRETQDQMGIGLEKRKIGDCIRAESDLKVLWQKKTYEIRQLPGYHGLLKEFDDLVTEEAETIREAYLEADRRRLEIIQEAAKVVNLHFREKLRAVHAEVARAEQDLNRALAGPKSFTAPRHTRTTLAEVQIH